METILIILQSAQTLQNSDYPFSHTPAAVVCVSFVLRLLYIGDVKQKKHNKITVHLCFCSRWFQCPKPPGRWGETEASLSTSWCSRCRLLLWASPPTLCPCFRTGLHLRPHSTARPQPSRTRSLPQHYHTLALCCAMGNKHIMLYRQENKVRKQQGWHLKIQQRVKNKTGKEKPREADRPYPVHFVHVNYTCVNFLWLIYMTKYISIPFWKLSICVSMCPSSYEWPLTLTPASWAASATWRPNRPSNWRRISTG